MTTDLVGGFEGRAQLIRRLLSIPLADRRPVARLYRHTLRQLLSDGGDSGLEPLRRRAERGGQSVLPDRVPF